LLESVGNNSLPRSLPRHFTLQLLLPQSAILLQHVGHCAIHTLFLHSEQ
jgi:hypothetical protein